VLPQTVCGPYVRIYGLTIYIYAVYTPYIYEIPVFYVKSGPRGLRRSPSGTFKALIRHLLKMSSVGTSYLRSSGAGESIVEESAATDAEAETVELDAEGKQVGPGKQRWTPQEGEGEEEEAMDVVY